MGLKPANLVERLRQRLARAGWRPRSRAQSLFFASLSITLLMFLANRAWPSLGQFGSWQSAYFTMVLVTLGSLTVVFYRWLTQELMWRLRNRLIVTYIFIGVIPLILLATIFILAGYIFAGQFATFVVSNDLTHELRRLESANSVLANSLAEAVRRDPNALERPTAKATTQAFAGRQVVAYHRGKVHELEPSTERVHEQPTPMKSAGALVVESDGKFYLRACRKAEVPGSNEPVTVVSSVPLDEKRLAEIASGMGIVSLSFGDVVITPAGSNNLTANPGNVPSSAAHAAIQSGELAPARSLFDIPLNGFGVSLPVVTHETGTEGNAFLAVRTRPSVLYARLFRSLGDTTEVMSWGLIAVCLIFAAIELVALIVGIRLTTTMTGSVSRLYDATEHINRGDFTHRIQIRRKDQLAALEYSFNSMTENLQKLIAEQKEKQRIESELGIAKEVQALLFPNDVCGTDGLEIHGVCRPARTVSGDYYDFLPMGARQIGIAVGDISGKGISAALMMATVHAFVRAYTLVEQVPALATGRTNTATHPGTIEALRDGRMSAGELLSLLNQQLYQSTPAEKYATMFLGFYHPQTRRFYYSNAGHLPPLLINADGRVHQLSEGGTVCGLFGNMTYPNANVQLNPGDILVAYSDGVTEPENEFGEFGVERLAELVQLHRDQPLARISDEILTSVADWIGGHEQPDDCTIVLARAV